MMSVNQNHSDDICRDRGTFITKVEEFYDNESQLLQDDLCERALVFRLGCRLYAAFSGCSVYCEYNKAHGEDGVTSKGIPGQIHTYPDILIFSDTINGSSANKIVIEVKKANNNQSWETDIKKLKWFTDPVYKYRYKTGYHLILAKTFFILCLYERGSLVSAKKYIRNNTAWIIQTASLTNYATRNDVLGANYE